MLVEIVNVEVGFVSRFVHFSAVRKQGMTLVIFPESMASGVS